MPDIVDVSSACGPHASDLVADGVRTVIRYYSRDTGLPAKRLSSDEAKQLTRAGLRIGVVHEARRGDLITSFSEALGRLDGAYARTYGATVIGQPAGSTIYFGADVDANSAQIKTAIIPYFSGVAAAFAAATAEPAYAIGVYGSGATCAAVLDAGLAQMAWLAQSRGWAGYSAFLKSGRWNLCQGLSATVGGVPCDPNQANPDGREIGDFALATPTAQATAMQVIARSGLRLRTGPGVDFPTQKLIPYGAMVHVLKAEGAWSLVDLEGDGAADGFVSTSFLASA